MMNDVIYLDTNHLSALVRNPEEPSSAAVLLLLSEKRARLAFSIFHAVELTAPSFKSYPDILKFLDDVPVAWAVHFPDLFDAEVDHAFQRAVGSEPRPVQAFFDSPAEAWNDPLLGSRPPSGLLEAFRSNQKFREMLLQQAMNSALTDAAFKTQAAAVQRPAEPLLSRIRDQLRDPKYRRTPSGLVMPVPLTQEEVFRRAGGLPGFPAYQVFQALNLTRLKDLRYPTESNDIVDEWHTLYSPYVSVTAVDRRTLGRLRATRLAVCDRVTTKLADVPQLFALSPAAERAL